MILTDTHTHLYLDQFDEDRDEVITRAINQGVQRIFLPNIDSTTTAAMNALCAQFPKNCFPMMGLHPCSVKNNWQDELDHVKAELDTGRYCAVGEIGMDLYWDKTHLAEQKQAFATQTEWAKELKLPIVIHVRDSFNETFEVVEALNDHNLTGIFHCFTGTLQQAQRIIDFGGFKLGIGGVVTFKNSGLDEIVKQIPLKHLVLETDAPYLTPAPYRGKRNETGYVILVAEKLAEIYDLSVSEIASITTQNSIEVFRQ